MSSGARRSGVVAAAIACAVVGCGRGERAPAGATSAAASAAAPAPALEPLPDGRGRESRPEAAASAPAAASASAPPALACLARLYVGTPTLRDGAWTLVLPDGHALPWDDRRAKAADERLDHPDLEDTLATPYRAGPIAAPAGPDEDPGRVRVSELFEATYGASRDAVVKQLVPWKFGAKTLTVHRKALAAFARVGARLEALLAKDPSLAPFFEGMGGTFVWRPIAGTNRPSSHSFGVSLDLNPARSRYWRNDPKPRWRNEIPQAIVDAFEAEQFVWGGRWAHYDTMHFEWRPELFECR